MTKLTPTTLNDSLEQLNAWDTERLQQLLEMLTWELRNRQDCDYLCILWQVEDIQMRRPDLDVSQCRQILRELHRRHNAEIGINWDMIDFEAEKLYAAPENIDELREQAEYESDYYTP